MFLFQTGRMSNSGVCAKCTKNKEHKEYFQIQCADFNKYVKCQSKCVSSQEKVPSKCFHSPECLRICESKCRKLWPGRC